MLIALGTDTPACVAYGAALQIGEAGEAQRFTIEARDRQSNMRKYGGDCFTCLIKGPKERRKKGEKGSAKPLPKGGLLCDVDDKEDGTYEVSYLIDLVGHYTVSINMFGQEIHGSPFELLIAGGASSSPHTVLRGVDLAVPTLPPTTAGTKYTCTVEAHDSFGNPRNRGGDRVLAFVTGRESFNGSVVDNGDGTYEVLLLPQKAGDYLVAVTLNGEHIAGSRYALHVSPATTVRHRPAARIAQPAGRPRGGAGGSGLPTVRPSPSARRRRTRPRALPRAPASRACWRALWRASRCRGGTVWATGT